MTIFLLRHEQRYTECTFFVPLTPHGLENSHVLSNTINEINPDIIFCSPFLRTIQTIYPYCKKYNKKINIEYSLYEYLNPSIFSKDDLDFSYKKHHKMHQKIINQDYATKTNLTLTYPETSFEDVYKRISPFIDTLPKNKNILIISHMTTLSVIKAYLENRNIDEDDASITMGSITHIKTC